MPGVLHLPSEGKMLPLLFPFGVFVVAPPAVEVVPLSVVVLVLGLLPYHGSVVFLRRLLSLTRSQCLLP